MRPRTRRRLALWAVVVTGLAAVADTTLFLVGSLSNELMLIQTLVLSWLALTVTAIDIWATTDVRVTEDEKR
jgi:hypothetical protein